MTCTSQKMLSTLGMEYEKIDACKDNSMLFDKEHKNEMKCLKCGKSWFIEVINEDGEKVTTKVSLKKTARHTRWQKEGVREKTK
jgi:hypothetical protein